MSIVCYVHCLLCPVFVMSAVCYVRCLLCPLFVMSAICYVQCLLCLVFVLSIVCLSRVWRTTICCNMLCVASILLFQIFPNRISTTTVKDNNKDKENLFICLNAAIKKVHWSIVNWLWMPDLITWRIHSILHLKFAHLSNKQWVL